MERLNDASGDRRRGDRVGRPAALEVWHECTDLDLAVWIDTQDRLGDLRRATALALRQAFEAGTGISVVAQQVDVFLFEPGSGRYLGRLCRFATCPKGKRDCLVPGGGTVPFNKRIDGFTPWPDLLAAVPSSTLYRREGGWLRSATELPLPEPEPPRPARNPAARRQGAPTGSVL